MPGGFGADTYLVDDRRRPGDRGRGRRPRHHPLLRQHPDRRQRRAAGADRRCPHPRPRRPRRRRHRRQRGRATASRAAAAATASTATAAPTCIDGGFGRDTLTGGRGADVFRFLDAGAADGDRILDFGDGADRIDLSALDATRRAGTGLDWIGGGASPAAPASCAVAGRLLGDLDGDGLADFAIRLDPDADLGRADLIL